MRNLQEIKSSQQSKYDEIIEYLKQDNGYWLENDKWDFELEIFFKNIVKVGNAIYKHIDFSDIKNINLKSEVKFFFLYHFKEGLFTNKVIARLRNPLNYFTKFFKEDTLLITDKKNINDRWRLFLINNGIKFKSTETTYFSFTNTLIDFIKDFYDDREETEKDIWYSKNIVGAKLPASGANHGNNNQINFTYIPINYREAVKRYFKTIITKKSWNHCFQILNHLNYFFEKFYSNGYADGFIENLSRKDIENYLYWVNNDYKDKNATYKSKFVSYVRTFLEYIQMAQYDNAPKKEISFLIFQDDIPKRELNKDAVKKLSLFQNLY